MNGLILSNYSRCFMHIQYTTIFLKIVYLHIQYVFFYTISKKYTQIRHRLKTTRQTAVELKCDFNTLNLTYNTLIFSKFSINTRLPVATEQRLSYVCELCLDKFVQVFKGLIV